MLCPQTHPRVVVDQLVEVMFLVERVGAIVDRLNLDGVDAEAVRQTRAPLHGIEAHDFAESPALYALLDGQPGEHNHLHRMAGQSFRQCVRQVDEWDGARCQRELCEHNRLAGPHGDKGAPEVASDVDEEIRWLFKAIRS
jgi:hypothetical protein